MKNRHVEIRIKETSLEDLDQALDRLSDSLDKLEGCVDDKLKDVKKYDGSFIVPAIIIVLCALLLFMLSSYGWKHHDDIVDRCTEVVPAYNIENGMVEQEYVHNGIVMRNTYYKTVYEFDINGITHTAGFSTTKPIEYNGIVDVYYNPDNPDEWYADASVFDKYIVLTASGNWISDRSAGLPSILK